MSFLDLFKKSKKEETAILMKEPKKVNTINNEKVAARKGELGEYKIDIQLAQLPKEYRYLSDLLIKNKEAKSGYSQIDHVVITPYGIFVIETKNYQGTIYGGKERKTWLVNGKFKMMNPFIQNYGHIQALKNIISPKHHKNFISMVSFTKRCTFKVDLEFRKISSNDLIVYDIELSEYIHRKVSVLKLQSKEPFLSNEEIESIYLSIKQENIEDPAIRELHKQALKDDNSNKPEENKVQASNKCSICSAPVSEKVRDFCLSNKKFEGKIYCFEHQKTLV
ncbi:nuclease-related domain-containing protein [Neobacillus sp. D3-1R]|uniref:nuclease-related domain-containing protein n=1 Tax=Neobacillus sp. D3-1R TaxID=3445778 RepID=UPI003F9F183E